MGPLSQSCERKQKYIDQLPSSALHPICDLWPKPLAARKLTGASEKRAVLALGGKHANATERFLFELTVIGPLTWTALHYHKVARVYRVIERT